MSKEEIRAKIRKARLQSWLRNAERLRKRKPEESLKTMFDLIEFSYKLNKAGK